MLTFDTALSDWTLTRSRLKLLRALENLGIKNVKHLLFHFPSRHEDLSSIKTIADAVTLSYLPSAEKLTIRGKLTSLKNWRTPKKRINITEGIIEDETGKIKIMWFNQPFLMRTLKQGYVMNFSGKISRAKEPLLQNPTYEFIKEGKETIHTGRLTPIYPGTKGVTSRWLRFLIAKAFPLIKDFPDPVPNDLRQRLKLPPTQVALSWLHFPQSENQIKVAKIRFSFEEMLLLQLLWLKVRQSIKEKQAPVIPLNSELIKNFLTTLPFSITQSQRKAVWDVVRDLSKQEPMNRLVEGDVGSGKTLVAAISSLGVFQAGKQVAIMAPTEILARQHFSTFQNLLKHLEIPMALLTGKSAYLAEGELSGEAQKSNVKEMIQLGKIKAVIGTTSLIQKEINFRDLGLVVVDEQHRFGIKQRSHLARSPQTKSGKKSLPHFLSLTATPIPRTLALTLFGDLDLSLLEEMPKGDRVVSTKVIATEQEKKQAYDTLRKEVTAGKRAFVVCPRIESQEDEVENETETKKRWKEAKAVEAEFQLLSEKTFPDLAVGKLHGRMKSEEKENVIQKFRQGEIKILVTTSVIEVGVDIPEATIMLIEGAEYFGLAQLHQLRGRIGRSGDQGYFFLSLTSPNPASRERLQALEKISSGFELAEIDLKLRGPGEFLGTRQWGQADLGMLTLIDTRLIQRARAIAQELMTKDGSLQQWPELKKTVEARFTSLHRE